MEKRNIESNKALQPRVKCYEWDAIVLFPRIRYCLSENGVTTLSQASKNTPNFTVYSET